MSNLSPETIIEIIEGVTLNLNNIQAVTASISQRIDLGGATKGSIGSDTATLSNVFEFDKTLGVTTYYDNAATASVIFSQPKVEIKKDTEVTGNMTFLGTKQLIPDIDNTGEIGTDLKRWNRIRAQNVVTGDLDMIDEGKGAHWTLIEEHDRLLALNRITGKTYEINLTEVI